MGLLIHWHEGLFLQPHHLQRMQKGLLDGLATQRRLDWHYPFGLVEARLSADELEARRIRFDRLRVIMPSGIEVNYPEQAELPSLDISQEFQRTTTGFTVYLGVPLWQEERANAVDLRGTHLRAKLLYRPKELQLVDENTGQNPKPIGVRMVNARLLLEGDDRADLDVIPLLRVRRAVGEDAGSPRQDPEYVPPCLVLGGSPVLRELVRDLVAQVEASRKELVVQLTRGGFDLAQLRGLQFEQVMRLRTLNHFSARLPALVENAGTLAPFQMYLELRALLGELAALHPDQDQFGCAPYDHENPFLSFTELNAKIRPYLRGAIGDPYLKVEFKEENGFWIARLEERHFKDANAYLLAIRSKVDPIALARFVVDADKFKLMPDSMKDRRVRGIELQEERHPPLTLPAASDLYYFRIVTAGVSVRWWERVRAEKAAAVVWEKADLDLSAASFTLYMTLASGT